MSKKDYSTDFYVYAHYRKDPEQFPDEPPYYIGKGRGDRWRRKKRNVHHRHILNKYGLYAKKLAVNLTKSQAFAKEEQLIAQYGRLDQKTGVLVNQTSGGDGHPGGVSSRRKAVILVFADRCEWFISMASAAQFYKVDGKNISRLFLGKARSIQMIGLFKVVSSKANSSDQAALLNELEHTQYNVKAIDYRAVSIKAIALKKCTKPCRFYYSDESNQTFPSFSEAARQHKVGNSNLVQMAKGQRHTKTLRSNVHAGLKIIKAEYVCPPSKS